MSHYKNGRKALIGDPVVGNTYNRTGIQVGILAGVTPDSGTCNARVIIVEELKPDAQNGSLQYGAHARVHLETDGVGNTRTAFHRVEVDYTQCDHLLHAEDAFHGERTEQSAAAADPAI